jgi:hypothetical protein
MQWVLKPDAPQPVRCTGCNGKGGWVPWGGYPDEWETCETCRGNRVVPNPELNPKPKTVPDDLFEKMVRTWKKYFSDKGDKAWTA